jgi:hypothetical protein
LANSADGGSGVAGDGGSGASGAGEGKDEVAGTLVIVDVPLVRLVGPVPAASDV